MKNKIIAFLDTPFQVMLGCLLRTTVYKNCDFDVVLADHIKNYEPVYEGLLNSKIFGNVFLAKVYKTDNEHSKYGQWKNTACSKMKVEKFLDGNKYYDKFLVSDDLTSTNWIYNYLHKYNPDIKAIYFEETPIGVLSGQPALLHDNSKNVSHKGSIARSILNYHTLTGNIAEGYSSISNMVKGKFYFPIKQLPMPNNLDEYIRLLNSIWGYKEKYNFFGKVIFFEQSFRVDGVDFDDIQIVKDIISVVGKENVLIKMHPRSRENRFSDLGVDVKDKTYIPWEIIALNMGEDANKPILISYSTGALVLPQLYWGISQKSISLVDCEEYKIKNYHDKEMLEYFDTYKKICKDKRLGNLPKNREEFLSLLGQYWNMQDK